MKQNDLFDIVFDKLKRISVPLGLILTMFIWQVLGIVLLWVFGIDYKTLNESIRIICAFSLDLLFLGLLFFIYRKDMKKDFKNFFNKNIFKNIKLSFNYWMVGMAIMVFSNYIIAIITNGALAGNEEAVRESIDKFPLYMAFQVMFYAPLTEEIIFRKSIRNATKNKWLFVIISGLVFGGLHVISSVEGLIDLVYLVPYCSLGCILALLYTKSNNIFSSIVAHSFHNTLALILYWLV